MAAELGDEVALNDGVPFSRFKSANEAEASPRDEVASDDGVPSGWPKSCESCVVAELHKPLSVSGGLT